MIEYQAGKYLRDHLIQPLLEMHSLDKTAQDPAQLNLKGIQHWEMHHFPKEIIPMTDWSHCEKFSLRATTISLGAISAHYSLFFHVFPCKNELSILFVATF